MPDVGAVFSGVAIRGRAVLGRLDPTGWRPTIMVASVLLAVVFGTQIINAALPAARPVGPGPVAAPGTAIPVGNGVYIYPPQGWVAQAAGSAAVRLTKGSVELYARTDLTGDPATMLDTYVRQVLETAASQLTVTTPAPPTVTTNVWAPSHRVPETGMLAWSAPDPRLTPMVTLAARLDLRSVEQVGDWARVEAVNCWTGWVDARLLVRLSS